MSNVTISGVNIPLPSLYDKAKIQAVLDTLISINVDTPITTKLMNSRRLICQLDPDDRDEIILVIDSVITYYEVSGDIDAVRKQQKLISSKALNLWKHNYGDWLLLSIATFV